MSVALNPDFNFEALIGEKILWVKGQQEIGEQDGYHHYQFCLNTVKIRLPALKRLISNDVHLELTRSERAVRYVNKDETAVPDTQFEFGQRTLQRNNKKDWQVILSKAKEGNFQELEQAFPDVVVRHYTTLQKIWVDSVEPAFRPDVTVNCYWGVTRSGKTHRCFEEAGPVYYIKNPNTKWWDGYKGQRNVIIDEFTGLINISYLLSWFDKYPAVGEVKNSQRPLQCTNFWITSNVNPREWYPAATELQKDALMARFTNLVHFTERYVPN